MGYKWLFVCGDCTVRTCHYFLGLGKYAPTPEVAGDMGWLTPRHKQWLCVMRKWLSVSSMDNSF